MNATSNATDDEPNAELIPANFSAPESHLRTKVSDNVLFVFVHGSFDLSLNFLLRKACQLEASGYREYVFSLSAVTALRDSGLAWLLMFNRKLKRSGAELTLCNCRPDIANRCSSLGLLVK